MSDWLITEDIGSRSLEIATPGQPSSFERKFFAKIDPDNEDVPLTDTNRLVNELWIQHSVAIRERWADSPNFICRRLRFTPLANARDFDITATYETFAFVGDPQLGAESEVEFTPRPPFVRRSTSGSIRTFPMYRFDGVPALTMPLEGDATGEVDMAGEMIDQQGTPMEFPLAQIETQLDVLYDTTDCFVDEFRFANLIGTRNEDDFIGYPAGTLLCVSATTSEIGPEWYVITFRYLYDPFYHMRQVATLKIDGRGPDLTAATSGTGKAAKVFWFQPYKDKTDFSAFFFDEEMDYLTRTCTPPDPPLPGTLARRQRP